MGVRDAWLPFGLGSAGVGLRLFCFPFAGGGASNFMSLRRALPWVGVAPVQYPGHETRLDEPLALDLPRLIDDLAEALRPAIDRPYALLGTSMGARIAFALAHRLIELGYPAPQMLWVVANAAPDGPSVARSTTSLPDAEFLSAVQAYGGTPAELLADADLRALLLPILRADFRLAVQPLPPGTLPCPIRACAGRDDPCASPVSMQGWARFTSADFQLREFEGGHFFFRDHPRFAGALHTDALLCLQTTPHAEPAYDKP